MALFGSPQTASTTTTATASNFYKAYSGAGGKTINLGSEPDGNYYIIHLTCTGKNLTGVVKLFGANGNSPSFGSDFSVIGLTSYDGRVLVSPDTVKFQIGNVTSWTVEVQSLSTAKELATPGSISGRSDEVINLTGNALELRISAVKQGDPAHISVSYYEGGDASGGPEANAAEGSYTGVLDLGSPSPGPGLVIVSANKENWKLTASEYLTGATD